MAGVMEAYTIRPFGERVPIMAALAVREILETIGGKPGLVGWLDSEPPFPAPEANALYWITTSYTGGETAESIWADNGNDVWTVAYRLQGQEWKEGGANATRREEA